MATHSNILPWRISWTEEPGELQSMESQRVAHGVKQLSMHPCMSPKRSPYSPAPATVRPLLSPETKCPQSINLLMTYSFPTL